MVALVLSIKDVLHRGLLLATGSREGTDESFCQLYGSSPLVLAAMWHELQTTGIQGAKLSASENSIR